MKPTSGPNEWKNTEPSIAETTRPPAIETGVLKIDSVVLNEYLKCKSLVSVLKKKINNINAKKPYKTMVSDAKQYAQEVKNSESRVERATKNKIFMNNQVQIAEMETLVHELQQIEKRVTELEIIEPRLNPTKRNFDVI